MSNNFKATIEGLKQGALSVDDASFRAYKNEIMSGAVKAANGNTDLELASKRFAPLFNVKPATLMSDMKQRYKSIKKSRDYKLSNISSDRKYGTESGRLVRYNKDQNDVIADCIACIDSVYISEGGEEIYSIVGKTYHGESFAFKISSTDFSDPKVLKIALDTAMGAQASVSANMTAHLGPAIKRLPDQNEIRRIQLFTRTGWSEIEGKQRFLIPGNDIENAELRLENPKHCYRLSTSANLGKGLVALEALLLSHPIEVTTVAFAFIMQAPLAKLAGWEEERYCFFIQGRTGSLKTAFAQALMCIWGKGFASDSSLIKWGEGATNNAIMALVALVRDMIALIDNFKPSTGQGSKGFISLMHNMLEGGEKERLQKNSELRPARAISAWPFCTGEDLPDTDSATLARLLTVSVAWPSGKVNDELKVAQELSEHLNSIGALWIGVLESWAENAATKISMVNAFHRLREKWTKILNKECPEMINKTRVATNLATNQLTWQILCNIPELAPVLNKFKAEHEIGLLQIATSMASSTSRANEAERFLEGIREMLQSNKLNIRKNRSPEKISIPGGPILSGGSFDGWWENSDLCLFPQAAISNVEKFTGRSIGVSLSTLYSQLSALNVIASSDKGSTTKSFYIDGGSARALHLKSCAVRYQVPLDDRDDYSF